MPFLPYLHRLGDVCASCEMLIARLCYLGTPGFADVFSELECSSHLFTSCCLVRISCFTAWLLQSSATCGLSRWTRSQAQKSICDGSRLFLLHDLRRGCWVSLRPRFTSSLVTWEGSLLSWLFFFILPVILQCRAAVCFCRENTDSVVQKNGMF